MRERLKRPESSDPLTFSTATVTKPQKIMYVFIGGPTDGSEDEWIEMPVKDYAIGQIRRQPYY